jgi:hypothetical protein
MFAQKVMELVQDARKHQTELTKQKLLKIIKKEINGRVMTYTGHKTRTINGQNIVDYIMPTIIQESRFYGGIPLPSREQIALVIRAMRMHPLLDYASKYDYSELSKPDEITKFFPTISSIGRFFRDAPLEVLEKYEIEHRDN